MAVLKLLSDVLKECQAGKRTGALFVSITGQSENLIRFYFRDGSISSLSFGPVKDRECCELLDCYDFEKAVYFDGMKSPVACENPPSTDEVIAKAAACGKQVQVG